LGEPASVLFLVLLDIMLIDDDTTVGLTTKQQADGSGSSPYGVGIAGRDSARGSGPNLRNEDQVPLRIGCDRMRAARLGYGFVSLDTKTLMLGGSTRMIKAEGTCTISASRSTISCHLWAISEGILVELPNTIDLIEWPAADGTSSLRLASGAPAPTRAEVSFEMRATGT